jgi:hypothetical protein
MLLTPLSFKRAYVCDAPGLPLRMGQQRDIPIESLPLSSTLAGRRPCQCFVLLRLCILVVLQFQLSRCRQATQLLGALFSF